MDSRAALAGSVIGAVGNGLISLAFIAAMWSETIIKGWPALLWSLFNPFHYFAVMGSALASPLLWVAVSITLVGFVVHWSGEQLAGGR
jgi:hypothetical protein